MTSSRVVLQPTGTRREGKCVCRRDEPGLAAVDGEVRAGGEALGVDGGVDPAALLRLEGGDLREIEDVAHVDAVARDLDAAEAC